MQAGTPPSAGPTANRLAISPASVVTGADDIETPRQTISSPVTTRFALQTPARRTAGTWRITYPRNNRLVAKPIAEVLGPRFRRGEGIAIALFVWPIDDST